MQTDIVHTTRVHVLGIDLAKNSFSLHGVNAHGKCVLSKSLSRARLAVFVAQLPPCLIGMEACSGAHHWARVFTGMGHTVRIMAPRFVAPYRKGGKNDGNDAEAICEAVSRPSMRFVPVKSADRQAMLCLHRVRPALIKRRKACGRHSFSCFCIPPHLSRHTGTPTQAATVSCGRFTLCRRWLAYSARGFPRVCWAGQGFW